MRFVFAIVAFVVAAVLIGFGIAQRTVLLTPDRVGLQASVEPKADYIVIEPDALSARDGKQTIDVSGDGSVFVAYGRSSDVAAWLGDSPYVALHYDAAKNAFSKKLVVSKPAKDDSGSAGPTTTPAATPAAPAATPPATATPAPTSSAPGTTGPSPAGSDLWLDQFAGQGSVAATIDVPQGISVLIASGSTDPVPSKVSLTWRGSTATPWAGPLMVSGAAVFLIGVALLIAGFVHHRRSRGPRRNLPKGPRGMPRSLRSKPGSDGRRAALGRGRRALIAPVLLVPALALTACSPEYWPSFDQPSATATTTAAAAATPTASADATAPADPVTEPAVTLPQMERIMRNVAAFAKDADAQRKADALSARFAGPALEACKANYAIRAKLPDQQALPAIPSPPLSVILPQQATGDTKGGWPRAVVAVGKSSTDPKVVPTAVVMVQQTPRDQYKVVYEQSLAPEAKFPDVAPASVGAPIISPDFKGLVLPPSQVSAAFADILMKGADSKYSKGFDFGKSDLVDKLNAANRKKEVESANPTITLTATATAGDAPVVALATNDAGALVSTVVRRTEQSKPNDGGTTGFQDGSPAKALSGFDAQSAKGVQSTRDLQLLFYVPAVGSTDKIRLIGWSESLVAASEVP